MRLWEVIRKQRSGSGLSRERLAKLAEAKLKTIMNIETGRSIPTDETILKLGEALCLSRDEVQHCLALATEHRKDRKRYHTEYVMRMSSRYLERKRL